MLRESRGLLNSVAREAKGQKQNDHPAHARELTILRCHPHDPYRALALPRCTGGNARAYVIPNPLPIRALPQDSPDPSSLSSLTSGRRDRASPCASKQSPHTACTRVGKLARHPRQQCDRVKAGEIACAGKLHPRVQKSPQVAEADYFGKEFAEARLLRSRDLVESTLRDTRMIRSACHADARHVKLPQALIDEPFAAKIEVSRSIIPSV